MEEGQREDGTRNGGIDPAETPGSRDKGLPCAETPAIVLLSIPREILSKFVLLNLFKLTDQYTNLC